MKHVRIDLRKLLKGYEKGWVGISSDFKKVLYHGKTLESVRSKAKNSKDKIYFFPSGESYSNFVGRNDNSL